MRVALVGSREFSDWETFQTCVEDTLTKWGVTDFKSIECVVSGGARGADTLAERWARENGIHLVVLKADWQGKGRAAGVLRNTDIVNLCTHLIAFPSPKGSGTQDSVRKAKAAGKVVVEFPIE